MSGTGSSVAVRNGSTPATSAPAALAIRGNQDTWDAKQKAALVAMGVSEKATNAELAVFFHQCRNTQLDPFLKQIYLIHRKTKDGDRWVEKPTTQIGIDGFRVIRDRIADKKGQRVEYADTIWYDAERNPYDVWVWDEEPAACKVVVLVDGRRFPAVLRFSEYCQRNRDGDRLGRWRDGFAHQIEKCAEADALRRAFPNDMAGLVLEDAAPLDDPDAPDRLPSDRPRVTAEQARARATVTAEVVTPEPSPAAAGISPPPAADPGTADAAPQQAAGEPVRKPQRASTGQVGMIRKKFTELYPLPEGASESDQDRWERLGQTAKLAGIDTDVTSLGSTTELTSEQAVRVRKALDKVSTAAQLEALIANGEVPGGE
jgi:phage recombination protein Bet